MTGQDNQLIAQYLQNTNDQKLAELAELARSNTQVAGQLAQIIDTYPDEEVDEVKANAIRALGAANPDLLVAPLQQMLAKKSDYSDYTTRATAAYLAGVYKIAALKGTLEDLLRSDSSADVRYWSAAALGEVGDLSSLPVLQGATKDDEWADNQQTVASAAQNSLLMIEQRSKL